MAITVTEAGGATTKVIATDVVGTPANPSSGQNVQHVDICTGTLGSPTIVTGANPFAVGSIPVAIPSATFNRPANTTAYTSGDLVADTVTAGSVTPLSWTTAARTTAGSGRVYAVKFKKNQITTANAVFRVHLYGAAPTCTNGDNGVWLTTQSGYLGSFDLDASGTAGRTFSDYVETIGAPTVGSFVGFAATATTIWGLVEARGAYTPASGETFVVELVLDNPN